MRPWRGEAQNFSSVTRRLGVFFPGQCDFSFLALPSSTISDRLILLLGNEPNKMANMLSEPKKTFQVEFYV